jgi:enoyl-[acyl-carrier protein] reductase I
MVKEFEHKNEWALVLGGSSGLGLATAKKLAKHGMNICVVHRSMRSQLIQIEKEFNVIKQEGVDFISYNSDATRPDNIAKLIENLKKEMQVGKIKTLVHSIAKGNLKPMVSSQNPIESIVAKAKNPKY